MTETIHYTCYAWVLFHQYAITNEQGILLHAIEQLKKIPLMEQRGQQERLQLKSLRSKQLGDYHLNFSEASGLSNPEYRIETGSSSRCNNRIAMRAPTTTRNATEERVATRPPEKRQRVPSAYNQFIKEEIQRIKVNNPDISHREAFSTAAKNWAHFPHIHFGLMLETNNQARIGNV
ncbi:hypothetical protein K1719_003308 [Acacia pycnantha]|nr:hypothetical protein K1719_003308 [Acacia pycnantha]